jgi:hypothetical protein
MITGVANTSPNPAVSKIRAKAPAILLFKELNRGTVYLRLDRDGWKFFLKIVPGEKLVSEAIQLYSLATAQIANEKN